MKKIQICFPKWKKELTFMLVMAFLLIGSLSIEAQAEETAIDATQTTPYTYTLTADQSTLKVPISFSKAGVYTYKVEVTNFSNEVHVNVLDGELHGQFAGFSGTEHEFTRVVTEPTNRDFYVFSENAPAAEKTVKVTCAYYEPETTGREIKEGEDVRAITMGALDYSITLSKDSIVTVTGNGISLLDSDKKSLNAFANSEGDATVNLKKGTYYLQVSSGITDFKYTTQSLKLGTNTTKKKAKTIKLGKTVKMKSAATNKKKSPYYYKFTLKKDKKISVTADASKLESGSGTFDVYIFQKNSNTVPYMSGTIDIFGEKTKGKIEFSGQIKKGKKDDNYFGYEKSVKLPAGTYYMVVNNTCSGDSTVTVK